MEWKKNSEYNSILFWKRLYNKSPLHKLADEKRSIYFSEKLCVDTTLVFKYFAMKL